MTDPRHRSLTTPRTVLSLLTALAATLALAVPTAAAQENGDTRPDTSQRRGNPVAHCLPDQARGGEQDGSTPRETDTARTPPETDTDRRPETDTDRRPDRDTAGAAETGTARRPETGTAGAPRSEVAQCVQEALPDIVRSAHATSIISVVIEGIAQGHPDGTFRPEHDVSRAQMSTFLTRALDLEIPEGGPDAEDVDADNPHADGIAAVTDAGIALGKPDGSFAPNETVSRGQMAAFLTRALELAGTAGEAGEVPEDAAGSVHEESISAVIGADIARGFADGSYRPENGVTRGQMSTFLARGLGLESS